MSLNMIECDRDNEGRFDGAQISHTQKENEWFRIENYNWILSEQPKNGLLISRKLPIQKKKRQAKISVQLLALFDIGPTALEHYALQ